MLKKYNTLVGRAIYILLFLLLLLSLVQLKVLTDTRKVYLLAGFISVVMLFFQMTLLIRLRMDGFKPTSILGYLLLVGWLLITILSYGIK